MQAALEDIINKDLQVLASDMQKWVVQSFDEVTPPTPIADFPPQVIPEFGNVDFPRLFPSLGVSVP